GAYLPRLANEDGDDLARLPGVEVSATSEASLVLGDGQEMGWDQAGLSLAESVGVHSRDASDADGRAVALQRAHAQSLVLSSGRIERISLRVTNSSEMPVEARLVVRQAVHLRDIGSCAGEPGIWATLTAEIYPGHHEVAFVPDLPIVCQANAPVALIMEPNPDLGWWLTEHEPPGTQAASWDDELGYWRWLHGAFWFKLQPVSAPFGAGQVLSGGTRPETATNMWISDPGEPLPQGITLAWPEPVDISRIHLTFDSQLRGWIWEGTFPMIARDYRIETRDPSSGEWAT